MTSNLSHLSSETQAEALAAAVNTWQASLNLAAGPLFSGCFVATGRAGLPLTARLLTI